MTGTSTPSSSRSLRIISGTAAAACSVLTVTRTSCEPAWARRATWIAVASGSAVSVFVIDWTTIGWADPTRTPPTSTETVDRRRGRRESGLAMGGMGLGPARQDPDDVEAADPDQEREQEGEPDDVGQALGADADPAAEDRLQDDHQHPPAIERWEREAVHEREVGRQDPRDIERQDRPAVEEHVADLGRDPDRSRDRRRRRRVARDLAHEGAEAREDHAEPVDSLLAANRDRARQVAAVGAEEAGLEGRLVADDPERSMRVVDLVGRAKRDRHRHDLAVGSLHGERHGLTDFRPQVREDARFAEELALLAVDRQDRVTGLEAGGRRR